MLEIRAEKLRHGETTWVAIHDILLHDWDPIGVHDEPYAQDEYNRYIAGVWSLLEHGSNEGELVEHLDRIATERMGFTSRPEACRGAARALLTFWASRNQWSVEGVSLSGMGTTVHVSISDIELALDRARAGDNVVLDGDNESFYLKRAALPSASKWSFADLGPIHIERTDFRPLGEILADPDKKWSGARLDDQWERDVEQSRAEDRANDRDPWAE